MAMIGSDNSLFGSAVRMASLMLTLAFACGTARAEIVQGRLQLQWGDPQSGPGQRSPHQASKFLATLVADNGKRYRLDTRQALRAADNLYALANRRVAIEFSSDAQRTVEAIVSAERPDSVLSADQLKRADVLAAVVTGTTRWITIACKFPDIATEQKSISFFQGQYGTALGQLGHYWPEVSYGKINLTGSNAYGWFTLPQPRSYYVTTDDAGKDHANLDQLFDDCAAVADPTVTFTGAKGINMMFNGDLDGYAWGGGSCGLLEGVNTCISNTWNPPWSFGNLAPLSHEMGHAYGLPHSDNSDGDSDTYDNPWDVMSDAWSNAANSTTYGALPKHINIYQRDRLGWIDAARKLNVASGSSADSVQLDYASKLASSNVQMIVLPMSAADSTGKTLYVVESREVTPKTPFPYTSSPYESNLAGNAVIIHGITAAGGTAYSIDADVPPANRSNNEGSMFKVGESWISPNGLQRVRVDAINATGFVVTIGWPGPSTPPAALKATVTRASRKAPMSIDVSWTGGAARMDVFRNGVLARTIDNSNGFFEKYAGGVRPTFRLCNAGTTTCSPTVTTQAMRGTGPIPATLVPTKPTAGAPLGEQEQAIRALRPSAERRSLD
jgi:hypothetical protein